MTTGTNDDETITKNYFFLNNKKKILDNGDRDGVNITKNLYKDYIVIQCENLNYRVEKLNNELTELKKINLELEKENDKYDESTRYIKGVLHNFLVMKTDYENLYKESYNIAKKLGKFLKNLKKTVIFMLILYCIYNFISYVYGNNNLYGIIKFTIYITILSATNTIYLNITPTNYNDLMEEYKDHISFNKKKIKELDKIHNNQKYIEEYIDCLI